MSRVTDKLYSIICYQVDLAISGIRTRNSSGDGVVANPTAMPSRP